MNDQEVREHLKQFRLPTNYMRFYTAQVLPLCIILYLAGLAFSIKGLLEAPAPLVQITTFAMAVQLVLALAVCWLLRRLYRSGFLLNRVFLILACLAIPVTEQMAGVTALFYLAASLALLLVYTLPSILYFEKRRDLFSSMGFDHGEMDPYYFAASDDPQTAARAVHRKPVLLSVLACLAAIAVVSCSLYVYIDEGAQPFAAPEPPGEAAETQRMAEDLAHTLGFDDFDALLATGDEEDRALIGRPYPEKAELWAQSYGWEDFQACFDAMMEYADEQDVAIDPAWVFVLPEDASLFHTYDCPTFQDYDGSLQYFDTRQEALDYGSTPCPVCNP